MSEAGRPPPSPTPSLPVTSDKNKSTMNPNQRARIPQQSTANKLALFPAKQPLICGIMRREREKQKPNEHKTLY